MFDLIDEDLFTDVLLDVFGVLDDQYVRDLASDCLGQLRTTFDSAYQTQFLIVERETGKPMNVNALLQTRASAEEFLTIVGDKYEIGILLTNS
ncbi:MAG: hypothetical protein KF777_24990 [Planctomycetaceae bacterium]|nr:hypothetical protein [Planctomycetaceae bacterium]